MDPAMNDYERVSEQYRRAIEGHVYIRDTLDALFETVGSRMHALPERLRILELGSHAGVVTEALLERWPHADITVVDESEELVAMARRRLAGRRVQFHTQTFETLRHPVDLVVSVARHHHLPHDYLRGVRRVMAPGAVYALADEFCPEYCHGEHVASIEQAEVIHMARGYVLTSRSEVAAFEEHGFVPPRAIDLERWRRRALWRWYRFVVDEAVKHEYFDVAVTELKSTYEDLITGSDAEHKYSPLIVERQFAIAGFRRLSKRPVGGNDDPDRQSMFVYEFALA